MHRRREHCDCCKRRVFLSLLPAENSPLETSACVSWMLFMDLFVSLDISCVSSDAWRSWRDNDEHTIIMMFREAFSVVVSSIRFSQKTEFSFLWTLELFSHYWFLCSSPSIWSTLSVSLSLCVCCGWELNIIAGAEGISSTHEIFQNRSSLQILPGEEEDNDLYMFFSLIVQRCFSLFSSLLSSACIHDCMALLHHFLWLLVLCVGMYII